MTSPTAAKFEQVNRGRKAWVSPRYRQGVPTHYDFISEAAAESIIEAGHDRMGAQPAVVEGVDWRTRRRAQIAFPGLNPPFGPIQRFVSEIYSLDEPPYFKHFLEFETSSTEILVKIHRVRGDRPVEIEDVARISLEGMGPAPDWLLPNARDARIGFCGPHR